MSLKCDRIYENRYFGAKKNMKYFRIKCVHTICRNSQWLLIGVFSWTALTSYAQAPGAQGRADSPAAQRRPQTVKPQTYAPEQVQRGQARFAAQCGFCHGRDASGGEGGPDLTRSTLVAEDIRGDKIAPVLRTGRVERGMPAFDLSEDDLTAMVAFMHDQKSKAESLAGGRRGVDVQDLQTGNAERGRQYFNGAGGCNKCHSATGDLAGIARRLQGLALLQRILYPSGRPAPAAPTVTVTLSSGQVVTGRLAYSDEFTIALIDSDGWHRSWTRSAVQVRIDDPLGAHFDQLGKYTDGEMHDVFAYIQTLR
jgi:cytochrome c oxidase cbb3-type subunit 3